MTFPVIRVAEVFNRTSHNGVGTFTALIEDDDKQEARPVHYVSPYASKTKAGMVAIPEVGSTILVCKPSGSESWYYLGATFLPERVPLNSEVDGGSPIAEVNDKATPPIQRVAPDLYSVGDVPSQIVLKGPFGQGLEINSQSDGESMINVTTKLVSDGKGIEIKDSPGQDSISMHSGNNASITITSNPQNNPDKPAASVQVDSNGPQSYVCRASDLDIRVNGDGRELNIVNKASGAFWGAFQHSNPIQPCGNVNLQSNWGDVNIMSTSPLMGRIFIETINTAGQTQLIQLATRGPDGTIVLRGTRILLDADESIEMSAPEGVYINSGEFNLNTTDNINLNSVGGNIRIEPGAGVVDLAPGVPVSELPLNIPIRTRGPLNNSDYSVSLKGVE